MSIYMKGKQKQEETNYSMGKNILPEMQNQTLNKN